MLHVVTRARRRGSPATSRTGTAVLSASSSPSTGPSSGGEALEVVDAELGQRPDAAVVEPRRPGRAGGAVERPRRVRRGRSRRRRPPSRAPGTWVELHERRREQQQAALRGEAVERLGLGAALAYGLLAEHVLAGARAPAATCSACSAGGVITTTTSTSGSASTSPTVADRAQIPGAGARARSRRAASRDAHRARARRAPRATVDRVVRGRPRARCPRPENRRQGVRFHDAERLQ